MGLPIALSLVVVTLVALIYSSWIIGVRYALLRTGGPEADRVAIRALRIVLGGFLLVTAVAGMRGFWLEGGEAPSRLLAFATLSAIAALFIVASPWRVARLLDEIPEPWLVYSMAFRAVATGVVAYIAAQVGGLRSDLVLIAIVDIGLGVSALALGKIVSRRPRVQLEAMWSVLGLLTWCALAGYYVRLLLFGTDAAFVLRTFPYLWLPVFVFPHGLALHVLLIRKIRASYSSSASPLATSSRSSGSFGSTRNSQPSP